MGGDFPLLMRFTPAGGSPVGLDTQSRGCLSTDGRKFFSMRIGNTSDDAGLRAYDMETGAELAASPVATIYGGANEIAAPYCFTPSGNLLVRAKGWNSNGSAQLSRVNASTLALIDTLNDSDIGGGLPSLPVALGSPQCFGATSKNGVSYVAAAVTATLAGGQVNIVRAGGTQYGGHSFNVAEFQALCCGSPANWGKIYTLGVGPNEADSDPATLYVTTVGALAGVYDVSSYPTLNGAIGTVPVGSFSPPDIDEEWETWLGLTAPGLDQSDGHLLMFATTTDSGATNKCRLVKIDSTDGHIRWSTPMPFLGTNERFFAMPASDINGGKFKFLCPGDQKLYIIDTSDGSVISDDHMGLGGAFTITCSIDSARTNSVIVFGQWETDSVKPPWPVGGITGSSTPYWYRLIVGPPPVTGTRVKTRFLG